MTVPETIFATVVAALVVSIVTFLAVQLRKRFRLASGTIRLKLSQDLPDRRIRLMVRHVRDGKDEVNDKGPLLNEDKEFSSARGNDEWVVTLQYLKNLGFQFKCYVECPPDQKEIVISFLASNGFREVTPDETHPNRVWFLLPKVPTCETVDHYTNNFYHPRIAEVVHEA